MCKPFIGYAWFKSTAFAGVCDLGCICIAGIETNASQ